MPTTTPAIQAMLFFTVDALIPDDDDVEPPDINVTVGDVFSAPKLDAELVVES